MSDDGLRRCHDCCQAWDGPTSRCDRCRAKRRASERAATSEQRGEVLSGSIRGTILARLRKGGSLPDAVAGLGVSVQRIQKARSDPEWALDMDAALLAGRDPEVRHGTAAGYRGGCRCSDCREAKQRAGYWRR